ncbi:NOL1/NOP2/Sun family protein [Heterostelium album PN500]|uniref:NOL1/NOP2/Sun family protein n=1 Tax=Heterostelium pallidum (strain ATCC 26659 / Pp 5 / PN500) TaxID=670386 RepID=D3B5B4_HETP5|nr:NOL1/NOP2/Sun family protein [Heterostelium album PN500]EFA83479.1 NOL1/NOP2/Sun family protein [Heterostelium album PN500]|eukprot:XP_020435596.1 NOL1/NOP2/Sun family protein [Heterostelium album PN500]
MDNNNNDIISKMNTMLASDVNLLEYLEKDTYQHLLNYYDEEQLSSIQRAQTTVQSLTCVRVNTLKISKNQLIEKLIDHFNNNNNNGQPSTYKLSFDDIISFDQLLNKDNNNSEDNHKNNEEILNKLNNEPGVIGSDKTIVKGEKVSIFVDLMGDGKKGFVVEQFYKERTVYIGNGISLLDRLDYFSGNGGVAIEMTERIYECPPLNALFPDLLFLQHLPSILAVFQLDVKSGQRVLDMCSAPGGKTTLIASLMSDTGTIIAIDKNKKKQQTVQKLCLELGIKSVTCLSRDSAKLTKQPRDLPEFADESFDRILLDGPCSGLGSRPRFIEPSKLIDLTNATDIQRRLIDNAVPLLKRGGILVYSTCTINPEENEQNVAYLLAKHSNMRLIAQFPHVGDRGLQKCGLTPEQQHLVQRFDPSNKLSSIGFFIARFIKE